MVLPVNHTDLDAEVRIGDTRAWVLVQRAQGLEVVLPPLPAPPHLDPGHVFPLPRPRVTSAQ